jgi:hypothetical protein
VEHASIGLDRVTVQKSPVPVSIHGGKNEKLDLGVIRGSEIHGEVAVFGLADKRSRDGIFVELDDSATPKKNATEELSRLYSLSNLQVELQNEKEVLTATTDSRGRFSFKELRPGSWELHVYPEDLPPYHDAVPSTTHLTVGPGSKEDIAIRIIPRTRQIHIVDEGMVPVVTRRPK